VSRRFISEPIEAQTESFDTAAMSHGEPAVPSAFCWRDEVLEVRRVLKAWRSTKEDRGDVYLARHWYEFETTGDRLATIYFDRHARPGRPRWWLYCLQDAQS